MREVRAWNGHTAMKAFIAAVVTAVVLAAGGAYLLDSRFQQSADIAFVGSGARL